MTPAATFVLRHCSSDVLGAKDSKSLGPSFLALQVASAFLQYIGAL